MTTDELSPFERKLRAKLAAKGQTSPQPVAVSSSTSSATVASTYESDVPTAEEVGLGNISPEQEALNKAIEGLGIVEAYNKWCKKMVPKYAPSQQESIKCSCPNPKHPDKNPSAWMDRKKNVYYCSGCAQGGDIWDIAAFHFGFPVPGYKRDKQMFRELREKIGADLGFQTVKGLAGTYTVPPAPPAPTVQAVQHIATVTPIGLTPQAAAEEGTKEEQEENQLNAPSIDWRSFVQPNSFLHSYLEACSVDVSPEEYHFWNGLIALGLAIGRETFLVDTKPVFGNLFVCLTGPSSSGKSRSKAHLDRLIRTTLPYDYNNPLSRGSRVIGSPNSAEYLIYEFQSVEDDPTNPKSKIYWPVRGLVDFEELSTLMGTASRMGNTIRPLLMSLYDAPLAIESGSIGGGRRKAEHPFGSVISTTQNRSLRKLLEAGDDGSGFINRWIFAQGKLKKRIHIGGTEVDLQDPKKKLVQIHRWSFNGRQLNLSPSADRLWYDFFHNTVVPTQEAAEKQDTAVIARMDLMMKKLFVLFAANRMESEISAESVKQAFELWPYLLKTFGVVVREIKKTANTDLQDDVINQIVRLTKANGRGPSRKQIYDCVKRKVSKVEELERLLTSLIKMELIHEIVPVPGAVGRPTTRYEVA